MLTSQSHLPSHVQNISRLLLVLLVLSHRLYILLVSRLVALANIFRSPLIALRMLRRAKSVFCHAAISKICYLLIRYRGGGGGWGWLRLPKPPSLLKSICGEVTDEVMDEGSYHTYCDTQTVPRKSKTSLAKQKKVKAKSKKHTIHSRWKEYFGITEVLVTWLNFDMFPNSSETKILTLLPCLRQGRSPLIIATWTRGRLAKTISRIVSLQEVAMVVFFSVSIFCYTM